MAVQDWIRGLVTYRTSQTSIGFGRDPISTSRARSVLVGFVATGVSPISSMRQRLSSLQWQGGSDAPASFVFSGSSSAS